MKNQFVEDTHKTGIHLKKFTFEGKTRGGGGGWVGPKSTQTP